MKPFKFQIWDTHKEPIVGEDGDFYWRTIEDANDDFPWKKFKFTLYPNITVDYCYETIIFQKEIPVRCTRVVLSDGTSVFAVWQLDTFDEKYAESLNDASL